MLAVSLCVTGGLVGKVIVAEMAKSDKRGAFDAFSLERGADRRPAGGQIVVFGVSNVPHDRFPARKAPIARICPTLVAQYWLETMLRGRGVR